MFSSKRSILIKDKIKNLICLFRTASVISDVYLELMKYDLTTLKQITNNRYISALNNSFQILVMKEKNHTLCTENENSK